MEFNERVRYEPVVDRPALRTAEGPRLIVWPIVVLETWDISRPMPRQIVPPPAARPVPDYLNWSWHEYEMRVAFWRIKKMFDERGIAASASINSAVITTYPAVAEACRDAGWEFVAHGVIQRPVSEITDERSMIEQCMRELEAFTGRKPRGWASPGIAQTADTVDHLAAAGLEYACDWILDDQPIEIETRHGRFVGLPYTADLNDVPSMVVARQPIETFKRSICDAFDRLFEEAEGSVRILTVVLHPYVCATSHRIAYIEQAIDYMRRPGVAFWTGDKILDWYNEARAASAGLRS